MLTLDLCLIFLKQSSSFFVFEKYLLFYIMLGLFDILLMLPVF